MENAPAQGLKSPKRIAGLDGLRAVAVICVFLHHAYPFPGNLGSVGVWLFFVVIGLGTNDFFVDLKPGEEWSGPAALHDAFRKAYVDFTARLRTAYPNALMVLTAVASRGYVQDVRLVAQELRNDGDTKVLDLTFEGLALKSCNYHPDADDHRKQARALIDLLNSNSVLWTSVGAVPLN